MITLYGAPASRAHRVMWMLKELNIAFDHVPTDFLRGGTRDQNFLKINPNGRVPVLVDDDRAIFESMAINLYLARKSACSLAPGNLWEDGQATQWSFWAVTEVEKPLLLAACNKLLFAEHERSPTELDQMLTRLQRPFGVLNAHLSERAYVLGERFTVTDLNIAAMMSLVPLAGIALSGYPAMDAWLHDCLERPAAADWKKISFRVPRPPAERMLASFV
jgi:glutathione S-transferase